MYIKMDILGVYFQIIICSRTHSQLSQLVGEVSRSPYNDVRLTPLASRQSYCVNAAVRKLNSLTLINEKYVSPNLSYKCVLKSFYFVI